ncbi:MAG: AlpA family transcriptional regulator [Proteobacteria bacterium]|nr:AlpA family transcriptional regulator [Pseudomonadota bacterium]
MPAKAESTQTIRRRPDVEAQTGLPKSSLYALIAKGDFPKPIKIGARAVGWLDADVNDWIEKQVAASRSEVVR